MRVALIRAGFIENIIVAPSVDFAQTLGYDSVGEIGARTANGWMVNGVDVPLKPENTEALNAQSIRNGLAQTMNDMDAILAASSMTTAQTLQALKAIARGVKRGARVMLQDFSSDQ
jgi:phage gp29-like protein